MSPSVTTSARAVLSFLTDADKTVSVSIPRARLDKSQLEAIASMGQMLQSGALCVAAGTPIASSGASLVKTVRTQIA